METNDTVKAIHTDTLTQIESLLSAAKDRISNIEPSIYDNDEGYVLIMARDAQEKIETALYYIRQLSCEREDNK